MPRKFKFCLHCRRTITESEFQRGLFVQAPQGMLCPTCARQLDEETEAAKKQASDHSPVLKAALSEAERAAQEPAAPSIPHSTLRAPHSEAPAAPPAPAVEVKPALAAPSIPHSGDQADRSPQPIAEKPTPEPPAIPHSALRAPQSEAPHSEEPAQLLGGIREHLEAIHRTLVFEKSSPWNVLATIAQCLAVGMLIVAAVSWAENPLPLLLVALIFQVMALTFFVRGK